MRTSTKPRSPPVSVRMLDRVAEATGWRCSEPVVVFESDDWGMLRRPATEFARDLGPYSEWADEATETPEDLTALYDVLGRWADATGRPACFVANFVVANADYERMLALGFGSYVDAPITRHEALLDAWRQGYARRVFVPQYHGRSHFWPELLLRDLRDDTRPEARKLLEEGFHGALSLLRGLNARYRTEYVEWDSGGELSSEELGSWIDGGLKIFNDAFGFAPVSTIAPHYIMTAGALAALQARGIRYAQAMGRRTVPVDGEEAIIRHAFGERTPEGVLCLRRTASFEPRPRRYVQRAEQAWEEARACASLGIPIVIDTHRINYTGRHRDDSLRELDLLLAKLNELAPRFLTTMELGEAIENEGRYRDVWSGEPRTLNPLGEVWRAPLRKGLASARRAAAPGKR